MAELGIFHNSLKQQIKFKRVELKQLTDQKALANKRNVEQKRPYQFQQGDILYFSRGFWDHSKNKNGRFIEKGVRYLKILKKTKFRDWVGRKYNLRVEARNGTQYTLNLYSNWYYWVCKK